MSVLPVCGFLLALLCAGAAFSQDAPVSVRRLFVPADRPAEWPRGDWRPVPLADLEKFLEIQDREARPPVPVVNAEYTATLLGQDLRGRLKWTVRPGSGEILDVSPLSLSVRDLRWQTGTADPPLADWGLDAQGRALLASTKATLLEGDWSLPGRRVGEAVLFEVEIPRSASAVFRVLLPPGWSLRSTAGDVQRPQASDLSPAWVVRLGGLGRAQWIAAPDVPGSATSAILVRQETEYRLRQDGLRFQTVLTPEFVGNPARELRLNIDPGLDVLAITAADGTSLPWKPADSRGGLAIRLPEPTLGAGARLRIDGVGRLPLNRRSPLPQIRVADGLLATGNDDPSSSRITLRVASPLQIQDLRLTGCRQVETSSAADEDRIVLRQHDPSCTIELQAGLARWRGTARVLTLLQPEGEGWSARTAAEWDVLAGSEFTLKARIAPGWDVVDVRPAPPATEPLDWVFDSRNDRTLSISFREPLITGRGRRLLIDCRSTESASPVQWELPLVSPVDVALGEIWTGLRNAGPDWSLLEAGTFRPGRPSDMGAGLLSAIGQFENSPVTWFQSGVATPHGILGRQPARPANAPAAAPPASAPPDAPRLVSVVSQMDLKARWVIQGADQYSARLTLQTDPRSSTFSFRLPAGTRLVDVRLDGARISPHVTQRGLECLLPTGLSDRVLEVDYDRSVTETWTSQRRTVPFPTCDAPVLDVRLAIEPGPDLWLGDVAGIAAETLPGSLPRWLGPLARSATSQSALKGTAADVPANVSAAVCRASRRQAAGWGVCALTLLLGLSARWLRIPGRGLAAGMGLMALVALGITVPDSAAPFVGAAHVGFWLAIFVPQRWLVAPAGPPVLRPAAPRLSAAIAVPLLFLAVCSLVAGQDRPAAPPRTVVLIPVDADERPSGEVPLAYVPEPLEARIRSLLSRGPDTDSLVRRVEYRLAWQPSEPPALTATFEVLVRRSERELSVPLPLRFVNLIGDRPCTVDGVEHPLVPTDSGFAVVLPPVTAEERSGESFAYVPREISVRMTPQADPNLPGVFRFGGPAVSSSRVLNDVQDVPLRIVAQTASGFRTEAKLADAPVFFGPAAEVRFSRADDAAARNAVPEVGLQVWTVCDVHPGHVQIQTRRACRVVRGPLDVLSFLLPEAAVVRDVQAADLLRWTVAREGSLQRLQIGFQRPQSGEVFVRIDWALPRGDGRPLAIPTVLPAPEGDGAVRLASLTQQWAWRPSAELQVSVRPSSPERVQPRTAEQFLVGFPLEGPRPVSVLETSEPLTWTVEARPLDPELTARSRSSVALFRDHAEVSFDADLTSKGPPLFQYALQVPRETVIERVSAVQDGTDPLLRWVRDEDRVTVFLKDRLAGSHRLRVAGKRPLTVPGALTLAPWRLAGASGDAEISMWSAAGVSAEITGAESLVPAPVQEGAERPAGARLVGSYRTVPDTRIAVKLTAVPERLLADRECRVHRGEGGWSLTWTIRLRPSAALPEKLVLHIPAPIGGGAKATSSLGETAQVEKLAGGNARAVFTRRDAGGKPFSLQVAATLPSGGPLLVPAVELEMAELVGDTISVAEPGLVVPSAEKPERLKALPEDGWSVAGAGQVTLTPVSGSGPRLVVSRSMAWVRDGRLQGRTELLVLDHAGSEVALAWPEGWTAGPVLVNGRLEVPRVDRGQIHLRTGGRPGGSLLSWTAPLDKPPVTAPFHAKDSRKSISSVTLVPDETSLLVLSRGTASPPLASSLAAWRALLDEVKDGRADQWLLVEILREAERARRLHASPAPPRLHAEYLALQKRTEDLRPADWVVPPGLPDGPPSSITVADAEWPAFRLMPLSPLLRLTAVLLAAVAGLLAFLFRRVVGFIQVRAWLAVPLLALLWLLFLAPSWVGLVFPAVAILEAILFRPVRMDRDIPSTITIAHVR